MSGLIVFQVLAAWRVMVCVVMLMRALYALNLPLYVSSSVCLGSPKSSVYASCMSLLECIAQDGTDSADVA